MSSKQVLMETLAGLFPDADQAKEVLSEVEKALDALINEVVEKNNEEINGQILEQYGVAAQMLREAEETAYAGYEEAAQAIDELKSQLEAKDETHQAQIEQVKAELEAEAYKNYEEACQIVDELQKKLDTLESELQETYEQRLGETRDELIERLDAFLAT